MLLLIVFKRLWGREYTKAPQRLGGTCCCLSILTLQTLHPCSGLPGQGQKPQDHLTLQGHRAGRHSTGIYHYFFVRAMCGICYWTFTIIFLFMDHFFFTRWCITWNGITPAQRVVPPPQRLWVTRSCVTPCVSAPSVHPYSRSDVIIITLHVYKHVFITTTLFKLYIIKLVEYKHRYSEITHIVKYCRISSKVL